MGYEEFDDGDLHAERDDLEVRLDLDDNQIDLPIERAQRLRDWLNRVLPAE